MRILGVLVLCLGLLFCLSIIGLPLGVFLILIGIVLVALGGHRKVVINNVVQVANNSSLPQRSYADDRETPVRRGRSEQRAEPTLAAPPKRLAEPPPFEIMLEDEPTFVDVRTDVSTESKRVLAFAKADGFQIVARPDMIIVRRDQSELEFRRNSEILSFGAEYGFE